MELHPDAVGGLPLQGLRCEAGTLATEPSVDDEGVVNIEATAIVGIGVELVDAGLVGSQQCASPDGNHVVVGYTIREPVAAVEVDLRIKALAEQGAWSEWISGVRPTNGCEVSTVQTVHSAFASIDRTVAVAVGRTHCNVTCIKFAVAVAVGTALRELDVVGHFVVVAVTKLAEVGRTVAIEVDPRSVPTTRQCIPWTSFSHTHSNAHALIAAEFAEVILHEVHSSSEQKRTTLGATGV